MNKIVSFMKAKVLTALILALILFSNSSAISLAANNSNDPMSFDVSSPEFPNAKMDKTYLDLSDASISIVDNSLTIAGDTNTKKIFNKKINKDSNLKNSITEQISKGKNLVGIISATMYVKELYSEVDGELICTESKLLTDDEYNSVNFSDQNSINSLSLTPVGSIKYQHYYNLYLNFGVYSVTPTSSAAEYYLLGIAQWQPTSYYNSQNPADGYDFIGFYWGGSYALKAYNAWTTYSSNNTYLPVSDYAIDSGLVWSFNELFKVGPSNQYPVSHDNITAEATIFKNTLTGSGNMTSFTCKYIHTYSTALYSATVSYPPAISVSPTSNQWSIVAIMNSLPY